MSMIGLFTGAPQATTGKGNPGEARAAAGFGGTLQQALDALAPPAIPPLPADAPAGNSAPAASPDPLVEIPADSPVPAALAPLGDTLESDKAPAAPLESPVATRRGNSAPAAPLVETSAGNSAAAATSSASDGEPTPVPSAAPLVEAPTGDAVLVSTSSASVSSS
ncbi:MAG: hypothetical protein WD405_12045, partial [Homoserinimonas sp.]